MAAAPIAARRYSIGRWACSLAYLARNARPTKRMPMPALTIVLPPNSQRRIGARRSRAGAARMPSPAIFGAVAAVGGTAAVGGGAAAATVRPVAIAAAGIAAAALA